MESPSLSWTSGTAALSDERLLPVLGSLLLLSLQFQTLPLPVDAQMMPPSSLIALFALPFVAHRLHRSPQLVAVSAFAGYAFLHSAVALYIDMVDTGSAVRMFSWARQFFALLGGVATFLVMRECFAEMTPRSMMRAIALGAVPALLLAMLNILWGALGQGWAGAIVEGVREFTAPLGYTSPMRATGFASEPSTFASVIVITLVPVLLMRFSHRPDRKDVLLMGTAMLALAWTFSSVGFILLFILLVVGLFLGPSRRIIRRLALGFVVMGAVILVLFPNNQVTRHATALEVGRLNVSYLDRYYSTVGPFMTSFTGLTLVGYGLGGTVSHFDSILPAYQQSEILAVKWKELPNLATLIGRIYAEMGAMGMALFVLIIVVGFVQARHRLREESDPEVRLFVAGSRLGFAVTLLSLTIAFGSFHMPYLWLWLACIDAAGFQRRWSGATP